MSKKPAFLLVLALAGGLSAGPAFSQGGEGGLVEGEGWAYLASAPRGWVRDSRALGHQGILGLFYKAGSSYSPSALHIYISPSPKGPGAAASLEDFMEEDRSSFMDDDGSVQVTDLAAYAPGLGYSFELKDFDEPEEGQYQAIAYYEGEAAYFVFVLSCRSAEERERERPSFLELLDSFTYVAKD